MTIATGAISSTVINDTAYNAFPGLDQLSDGKLLAGYVQSVDHVTGPYVFKYKISSDGGATWGTVATGPGIGAWVKVLADGSVIVTEFDTGVGVRVYKGTYDSGGGTISWGSAITAYNGFTGSTACASRVIQLANGDLIQTLYGKDAGDTNYRAAIVKSTNGGTSWGSRIDIASAPSTINYNESGGVLLPNGRIVVIIRNETLSGYTEVHSDDSGATWSSPIDVIDLGAGDPQPGQPMVIILPSGQLAMFTRGDGTSSLGRFAYWLSIGGAAWTPFTNIGSDVAFVYAGAVTMSNGKIGVVYSTESASNNADIFYQEFVETADPVLTANLEAFWEFEEVSGNRTDSHAGIVLTNVNTVASATGKVGLAADFENSGGEDQTLFLADDDRFSNAGGDFMWAFWVKPESNPATSAVIIQKGDGSIGGIQDEYNIGFDVFNDPDHFYFSVGNGVATTDAVNSTSQIPSIGNWYCVFAWLDETLNKLNIQINNDAPTSKDYSAGTFNSTFGLTIGAYTNFDGFYYDGLVDQLLYAKRIWTPAQRAWFYNNGNGRSYAEMITNPSTNLMGSMLL